MEVAQQIELFLEFLQTTQMEKLLEAARLKHSHLKIDFSELAKFEPELAGELLDKPLELMRVFQLTLQQIDVDVDPEKFRFRFTNLPKSAKYLIRNLRAQHIGKLIVIEGIVRQKSDVRPKVISIVYECPKCGEQTEPVKQLEEKIRKPSRCRKCGYKDTAWRALSQEMIDYQGIVLEEITSDLDGGQQPKRLKLQLEEDLVSPMSDKRTNPGTSIRVVGLLREIAKTSKDGTKLTIYDYLYEGISIESLAEDYTDVKISGEDEQRILEIAKDPNVLPKLIASLAPGIYGHDVVKEAILIQFVGGVQKKRTDGVKNRGDIHILLIGDPGSGKSQLLKRASFLAPKGRYVSGKGASGAGLTASVIKDEFLGGWTLEAGALVLANKGICLSGDTLITTQQGMLPIKEVVEKKIRNILSFNEKNLTLDYQKVIAHSKREATDVYALEFNTQDKLTITGEHPIPVWSNGIVWKCVKDIGVGEYIIDYRTTPHHIGLLSTDLAYLLGLLATDGSISKKYKITFYTTSEVLIDHAKKLYVSIGLTPTLYKDPRNGVYQVYAYSKEKVEMLVKYGLKIGSKTKEGMSFDYLLNESHEVINAFLAGVINGDGSISNKKSGGEITVVGGNLSFLQTLKLLCRKVGVITHLASKMQTGGGKVKKGKYLVHALSITGKENMLRLASERFIPHKQIAFEQIKNRESKYSYLHNIKKLLTQIDEKLDHTDKEKLYKNAIKKSRFDRAISRDAIVKMLLDVSTTKAANTNAYKLLNAFIKQDMHLIKVTKKDRAKNQTVYNIQVANTQTYFANFLPVHNCLIDELDKMTNEDRSAMHEALEQQTVTVAKANIQASLVCETTVLAAANPKMGRFDPFDNIAKQINLPPALINRFDLIFPFRDIPNTEYDTKLATFVLGMHQTANVEAPPIDTDLLRKYIVYARQNCKPFLPEEVLEEIKAFYVKMRNSNQSTDQMPVISLSARQLEGLIRLTEGCAKLRLASQATKKDAHRAIELLNYCLQQIGVDPETGKVDIDRIQTGFTTSQRQKIVGVREIFKDLEEKFGKEIAYESIIEEAINRGMTQEKAEEAIQKLLLDGTLFEPKRGKLSRIG